MTQGRELEKEQRWDPRGARVARAPRGTVLVGQPSSTQSVEVPFIEFPEIGLG